LRPCGHPSHGANRNRLLHSTRPPKFSATSSLAERLTQIPASRKKRVIVLRHLLERFEPGRDYPEHEVNACSGPPTTMSRRFAGSSSTTAT
jgi:hypothetical protein